MKVLITGKEGYLQNFVQRWLERWPNEFEISSISIRDDIWKLHDLSQYDAILHFASIVHVKENDDTFALYDKVNHVLTTELAEKAKKEGVSHFIYMSSMSVYGLDGSISGRQEINRDTPYNPKTQYGKSKLAAEAALKKMQDGKFCISVIRAPVIYGPGCPGNYAKLREQVLRLGFFPDLGNKKSMLFVLNFTELIRLILLNGGDETYYPQNKETVNTYSMAKAIKKLHSKDLKQSRLLSFLLKASSVLSISLINKSFGSLYYDHCLSGHFNWGYCLYDFDDSIMLTEKYWDDKYALLSDILCENIPV